MTLSKKFMIKVQPSMSEFKFYPCNRNNSQSSILVRFTFKTCICSNELLINVYQNNFKFSTFYTIICKIIKLQKIEKKKDRKNFAK